MEVEIPKNNLKAILKSKAEDYKARLSEMDVVELALDNPIGIESLEQMVIGKKT